MAVQWIVRRDGEEFGPVTSAALTQLVAEGRLARTDRVRREDMDRFVPASALKGLFSAVEATPDRTDGPGPEVDPPGPKAGRWLSWARVGWGSLAATSALAGLVGLLVARSRTHDAASSNSRPPVARGNGSAQAHATPVRATFSDDETTLLRLASRLDLPRPVGRKPDGTWIFEERADALHLDDDEKARLLVRQFHAGGRGKPLALWLFTREAIVQVLNEEGAKYKKEFAKFPSEMRKVAAEGILAGVRGEDVPPPFSDEFRRRLQSSTEWFDGLRVNKTIQQELRIGMERAYSQATVAVERGFAARLGKSVLPPGLFQVRRGPGSQSLYLKYVGTEPLTNVIVLAHVQQGKGRPAREVPNGVIDLFNRGFSTEKQADDANRYLEAMQTYSRMPKYASGYKATITPGQELYLDVGTMERGPMLERNTSTLAVFADQGRIEARDTLDFPALAEPARPPGRGRPELLKFGDDGVIKVKGRFTKDDKVRKSPDGKTAGKAYRVELPGGAAYTITYRLAGTGARPEMRVLGDMNVGYPDITWAKGDPSVARATVQAHAGTYEIDCYCPVDELVEYTLVIQRQ
jgi:hypothetical protein